MNIKQCTICKHLGKTKVSYEELDMGYLYDGTSTFAPVKVRLCRNHSIELFKTGQKRFLLNYRRILYDLVNSDEMEFIRLLDKTVRRVERTL